MKCGPYSSIAFSFEVRHVAVEHHVEVVGRDLASVFRLLGRVVADDVLARRAGRGHARGDRDVALGGPLDGVLAAGHRDPDRRMRLLDRPRPQRHVLVGMELALEGEDLLGPGPAHDLEAFVEPGAGLGHGHAVGAVLALGAAGDAGDQPPIRQAVQHGQLFGQPQRVVQREQVAVDQDLHAPGALGGGGGHQVRRVHQAEGRGVVLVDPDPVEAEVVHLGPAVQVLGVGLHGRAGIEGAAAELARQGAVDRQGREVGLVVHQVEDEDLQGVSPGVRPASGRSARRVPFGLLARS